MLRMINYVIRICYNVDKESGNIRIMKGWLL